MKIDLEIVRQILKDAFGFDSFIAGFINKVIEDQKIATAAINAKGELYYNSDFVEKYVTCTEDLFSLVFHELLHPMFCHFIHKQGMLENIAADAIINATISTIYPENSLNGNLFKKFYQDRGLQAILRPGCMMIRSRYHKVYQRLYSKNGGYDSLTTGELIQTLKILTQTENLSSIILIGGHEIDGQEPVQDSGFLKEVLGRMAEDIKRSLNGKSGRYAGFSLNLMELFMEALKTHLSIKKVLLTKFLTKRKLDRFYEHFNIRKASVSPIPIYPSKRDLVLLALGFYPGHFHNRIQRPKSEQKGLAVYLDVSGSVNEYLPKIIGILSKLKSNLKSIYLFSNKVVEIRFEDLLKGRIRTTYGTDFDCVAKSIIENRLDKAVIITDGYASMSEDISKQLKKTRPAILTILFDGASECEDLSHFGEVVMLEDICD